MDESNVGMFAGVAALSIIGVLAFMPTWWPILRLLIIPVFKRDVPRLDNQCLSRYIIGAGISSLTLYEGIRAPAIGGFLMPVPVVISWLIIARAWERDPLVRKRGRNL